MLTSFETLIIKPRKAELFNCLGAVQKPVMDEITSWLQACYIFLNTNIILLLSTNKTSSNLKIGISFMFVWFSFFFFGGVILLKCIILLVWVWQKTYFHEEEENLRFWDKALWTNKRILLGKVIPVLSWFSFT